MELFIIYFFLCICICKLLYLFLFLHIQCLGAQWIECSMFIAGVVAVILCPLLWILLLHQ
ncbi:unnamed protein product [Callosobruchus maculatus]|uniref:Uncharacterized protein n=1 Tax=Callosobruchus maculatus TaxID=64391 RepID=A0A653DPB1_CALMS|nr:unnamed protein product [Callosobruchus maculatus]